MAHPGRVEALKGGLGCVIELVIPITGTAGSKFLLPYYNLIEVVPASTPVNKTNYTIFCNFPPVADMTTKRCLRIAGREVTGRNMWAISSRKYRNTPCTTRNTPKYGVSGSGSLHSKFSFPIKKTKERQNLLALSQAAWLGSE